MSVVQRVLDDLLRQVVSGRRTGLHEDRNVSVIAVMGELGVIAEADSVFLSSGSRRCPIPGEGRNTNNKFILSMFFSL